MKVIVKGLNAFVVYGYHFLRNLCAACLACIFLSITVGIVSRYVFNAPITWSEEACCFLMVHVCFLSAATTTVKKKHIVADFLVSKAPPRMKTIVGYIGQALQMVFFVVLFFSVIKLFPSLIFKSPVLRIPRWAYYASALVCSGFMFFAVATSILNDFYPELDRIKKLTEKEKKAALTEEAQETAEIQKNMDAFMERAGYAVEHTEETAAPEEESK